MNPRLISIGLNSEDGTREFYAELSGDDHAGANAQTWKLDTRFDEAVKLTADSLS